jgi:hypothetical protein
MILRPKSAESFLEPLEESWALRYPSMFTRCGIELPISVPVALKHARPNQAGDRHSLIPETSFQLPSAIG